MWKYWYVCVCVCFFSFSVSCMRFTRDDQVAYVTKHDGIGQSYRVIIIHILHRLHYRLSNLVYGYGSPKIKLINFTSCLSCYILPLYILRKFVINHVNTLKIELSYFGCCISIFESIYLSYKIIKGLSYQIYVT